MIFLHKRKKLRFHTWMNEQKFIKSRERYLGTNLNIYIRLISLTNVKSSRYPYSRRFNDTRRISVPSSVRFIDRGWEISRNHREGTGEDLFLVNAAEIQDRRKWKSDREPRPPHWKQFSRQMFRDGALRFATTRPLDVHP